MFSNITLIIYGLLIAITILIGIYIWRRIYILENYTNILEKKIANLKKENKELHELLQCSTSDKCSFEQADILKNQIFNVENSKNDNSEVINISLSTIATGLKSNKKDVSNDTKIIIEDIKESPQLKKSEDISEKLENIPDIPDIPDKSQDITDMILDALPVAKHIDELEKDIDIESVISDNTNIYNKKKLTKMSLEKLKEICVSMNISTEGTKNNLIDRILSQ
jgi:hypothetical protein